MQLQRLALLLAACLAPGMAAHAAAPAPEHAPRALTTADVLAASQPADWRTLDAQKTLYLELPAGRVIIELAPVFAPHHVENVVALRGGEGGRLKH